MHTIFGLDCVEPTWEASIACIGVFDGVHLGHREIISEAVSEGDAQGKPSIVLTFDRHPMSVLRPEFAPKPILCQQTKLERIAKRGVSICVVVRFDENFASLSPDDFLSQVLQAKLHASKVVVGHDFAFGKDRKGTGEWLSNHIDASIVPPIELNGERVSSTQIRKLISQGNVEAAGRLLGEPFELAGIVVRGNAQGRQLGFPTLNLSLGESVQLPQNGVYAGECDTTLGTFQAAISLGDRPTFDGAGFAIEAHLLDYPGDELYGTDVRMRVIARLRSEERFDRESDLIDAMRRDIEATRARIRVK